MVPTNKCLVFAVLALLSNWEYTVKYDRPVGLLSHSIQPLVWLFLVAIVAMPVFLVRSYRLLRMCLARGVMIPREKKFIQWWPCVLLIPLLFHVQYSSVGFARDGAMWTGTFIYGPDSSGAAFVTCILLFILYQFYAEIRRLTDGNR